MSRSKTSEMSAALNLPKLAIEWVKSGTLKAYAKNPRLHSAKQIKQIESSIQQFGWTVPILVGPDNVIIAGHGRLMAAQNLGISEVPIIRAEHLSDKQARAYVIADNKLTENGEWDWELLRGELDALDDQLRELSGFGEQELAMLAGGDTEIDSFKTLFTDDALDTAAQRALDKENASDPDDDGANDDDDEPVEITCPHCGGTISVK